MLLDLNDACLYCVLAHLPSATDLVRLQTVCRRLRSVGLNNRLWIPWVYQDYGLLVDAASRRGTGVTSPSAGAQQLYGKLRTQLCPYSLHATAISTDGSCDEPYEAYWVSTKGAPVEQAVQYPGQPGILSCLQSCCMHASELADHVCSTCLPLSILPMHAQQQLRRWVVPCFLMNQVLLGAFFCRQTTCSHASRRLCTAASLTPPISTSLPVWTPNTPHTTHQHISCLVWLSP